MWWTKEQRYRCLRGAHARLIRAAIHALVKDIDEPKPRRRGAGVFAYLSSARQLAVLANVGEALLRRDVRCPSMNDANISAVAAIYNTVLLEVGLETGKQDVLDRRMKYRWRKMVLRAALSEGVKGRLLKPSCEHYDRWERLIGKLVAKLSLEPEPEPAKPSEKELAGIRERLGALTREHQLSVVSTEGERTAGVVAQVSEPAPIDNAAMIPTPTEPAPA